MMRFLVFFVIDLQVPQGTVRRILNQFFGFDLSRTSTGKLKETAAILYVDTYKRILQNIVKGRSVHVDETKINLNGKNGYVWVLASQENVAYFYSETREGFKVQDTLKKFKGVLISDFYSVYDSFQCPQQKCLIHLIRDLNDDVLRQPFNEELKLLVGGFSSVVKPIIETVDRYGLKTRFLRKHKKAVTQFYKWLDGADFKSEEVVGYKKRFEKNRWKLFIFLDHDDVSWNNNTAEHAIKAFARLRRVLGGKSTEKGIQEYLTLLSICETCRYRGIDFWDFLRSGYRDLDAYIKQRPRRLRRSGTEKAWSPTIVSGVINARDRAPKALLSRPRNWVPVV